MYWLHNSSRCATRPMCPVNICPRASPSAFQLNVFFLFCFQEGFVEFFRVADPESTVRNTLMAVAGVAGLGATLALLIR